MYILIYEKNLNVYFKDMKKTILTPNVLKESFSGIIKGVFLKRKSKIARLFSQSEFKVIPKNEEDNFCFI